MFIYVEEWTVPDGGVLKSIYGVSTNSIINQTKIIKTLFSSVIPQKPPKEKKKRWKNWLGEEFQISKFLDAL